MESGGIRTAYNHRDVPVQKAFVLEQKKKNLQFYEYLKYNFLFSYQKKYQDFVK